MSTLAHAEAGLTGVDQLPDRKDNQYAGKAPQHAGQPNSHASLDSRDGKSLKNKLDQAGKEEKAEKLQYRIPDEAPTDHAAKHGNEPSKGAKVDESLEKEDEKILKKKGIQV